MEKFVYCPRKSTGAMELVDALDATRIRKFDGLHFWGKKREVRVGAGDIIVCWGANLPNLKGIRTLNGDGKLLTKFEEARLLSVNKIATVEAHKAKPLAVAGFEYLGRSNHHIGGNDLLGNIRVPDFWVRKETLIDEFRVHVFDGKSLKAGKKVPRILNYHPWIRSYDAGWKIDYTDFKSNEAMRSIAKKAVKALGLTFGAVDVGQRADGTYIVLEVNRAPGIEGNTVLDYVKAINRWIAGPDEKAVKPPIGKGLKRVDEDEIPF